MISNKSNNIKKLPIGIQSFEKIRNDDYIYVDKTEFIYNLVNEGTYYFLSSSPIWKIIDD